MPPSPITIRTVAFLAALASASPAFAFSQIIDDEGEATGEAREGIVAVPLPPLPGEKRGEDGAPPIVEGETLDPTLDEQPSDLGAAEAVQPGNPAPSINGDPSDDGPGVQPAKPAEPSVTAPPEPPRQSDETPNAGSNENAAPGEALALSEIAYGDETLPKPVRDLRSKLMEIARSGEIEKLAPYLGGGESGTVLSFGGDVDDPIEHLKAQSGDADGIEILAILLEVLEAGHVTLEPGTQNAIHIWPYFAQTRIDTLTSPQKVELFELVTGGDYQAMLEFGAYNFYRLGITPEGELAYFVTGD